MNLSRLQTMGWKGLALILTERGLPNAASFSVEELADRLAEYPDFKNELSAVQHILADARHCGFFGAVCHPELAYIEMKWAQLKQYVSKSVDDTEETLIRLIAEAMDSISVDENRKGAHHSAVLACTTLS